MFDYIRYGDLPYEIQIMILKMGLEHPIARIIKDINLPEQIWSREPLCFYDHFFMFHFNKWKSSISFVDYTD